MSAVVDANKHVVVGSLVCQASQPKRDRRTHKLIVDAVNSYTAVYDIKDKY